MAFVGHRHRLAHSLSLPQVSKRNIFALNNLKSAGPENLFAGDRTLACRSDTDSQMIIHFPFEQNVKLFALILDAPEGAVVAWPWRVVSLQTDPGAQFLVTDISVW